jgi:hypothetical protein
LADLDVKDEKPRSETSWFTTQSLPVSPARPTMPLPDDPPRSAKDSPDSPTVEQYLKIPDGGDDYLIASLKRDRDAHILFEEIDKSEQLIEDFTCAWLRDILIHGRIYIFENHLAFHSKIIWTFKIVIPYKIIISIEKKSVLKFQNVYFI